MNGRIYDPLLGRFLSADVWVQFPGSLQSFNRYSYVDNNPLTRVDPSGFGWETIQMIPIDPRLTGADKAEAQHEQAKVAAPVVVGFGVAVSTGFAAAPYMATAAPTLGSVGTGMIAGASGDLATQGTQIAMGQRSSVDLKQTAASTLLGGLIGGVLDKVGRLFGSSTTPEASSTAAGAATKRAAAAAGEPAPSVNRTPAIEVKSGGATVIEPTPAGPAGKFPRTAPEMTQTLGANPAKTGVTPDGTPRTTWEPNANTRIRMESHPEGLKPGDAGYNPRHHGEHFHVETKPAGMSWTKATKSGAVTKAKPAGYKPGTGTGFLPGEEFP